jgi:phosphoribosylformylglycinamidine synthase
MTGRVGYYCAWVRVQHGPSDCVFTEFMKDGPDGPLPVPLAHAEGRFVTSSQRVANRLAAGDGVALVYATPEGEVATSFPHNPNGSVHAVAGLTNPGGNVLAIMPHPERAAWYHQVPRHVGGKWGHGRDFVARGDLFTPGPGLGFFTSLKKALS